MKAALLLLVLVAAGGCSTVKPWQRELLAQPGMSLEPTPNARAEQHMLESREASAGGFGGGGGGCGCN
ncbi:MAG: hypothetical protein JWM53_4824 [bacterium]|nr:hypothetical protein [bacterium]